MNYEQLNDKFGDYLDKSISMLKEVGLLDLLPDNVTCFLYNKYRGRTIAQAVNYIGTDRWEMRFCIKHFESWVKENNELEILDTMLHEFCHMMPGGFGHGKQWLEYVGKINKKFNMNIQRLG